MKATCEWDGTNFTVIVRLHPTGDTLEADKSLTMMTEEWCEEHEFAYPARYINCPTCCRGYFLNRDGEWFSDRALTIFR